METEERPLRFVPFTSQIDANFWYKFTDQKLDVLRLSEEPVPFQAEFDINLSIERAVASIGFAALLPHREPFSGTTITNEKLSGCAEACLRSAHTTAHILYGTLLNKNNVESFKSCDKQAILVQAVQQIIDHIVSGEAFRTPAECLCRMILLSFADLKKFHFYSWCAFPSASVTTDSLPSSQSVIGPLRSVREIFKNCAADFAKFASVCHNRMFVLLSKETLEELPLSDVIKNMNVYIVFADPSGSEEHVGWPLRNLLLLIAHHQDAYSADYDVISLRGSKSHNFNRSLVLRIRLKKICLKSAATVTCVGWEKNEKGVFGPRFVNLSSAMDPKVLAESAVDLNLKLMRWRLAPDVDLKKISSIKCLILGAGTLGCNVARCLLGWGVRRLTFVDNGRVSFSNPVRQSLFIFDDSLTGGRHKADVAAEAIRKIFPGAETHSARLTVPMPGHTVADRNISEVRTALKNLERLVMDHDVLFLLLDTREARWLPSLLGAAHNKIVVNAALGFDTFLVMRHGTRSNGLGCYFCNDVVAPTNSVRDRTLDQQCTVSRPGVSMIAAALAAELLVAMLCHPDGQEAAADVPLEDSSEVTANSHEMYDNFVGIPRRSPVYGTLGPVPHQIRCFLSRYHFMTPTTPSFSMCTACSPKVLSEYASEGFDFLLRVFNDDAYLEHVTGLAGFYSETQKIDIVALDDSDNDPVSS